MIKLGIIGSGFGLYGLLPAFNSIKNCQVVSICGKKSERLLNYCKKIGLKKIYSNWEQMLEKEKLDALAIAVPPSAQYKIAKVAIKKGLHIFAEKPLTANYKEAKELLFLAKKKKIVTAVDFIFPEIDEWKKAKDLIDKKMYGKLKNVNVTWTFLSYDIKNKITSWKTDVKKGGGALSFYASHTLYYLEHFAGEISKVKSKFFYSKESKNGGEVEVDLSLQLKSGIKSDVHVSCNAKNNHEHRLVFICEKAKIILESKKGVTEDFTLKVYRKDKIKKIIIKKPKNFKKDEDERVIEVRKIANRFIKGCIKRKQVVPSFREGARVQKLIEKIKKTP